MSDRSWVLGAPAERVWEALTSTDRYQRWWPWLLRFDAPAGLTVGATWRCAVKPPLPYTVRFVLALDEVWAPEHIAATVSGDIAGEAHIDLTPDTDTTCTLRLRSTLRPVGRPLVVAGAIAGPLTRWGHDWVLTTGVRQFAVPMKARRD